MKCFIFVAICCCLWFLLSALLNNNCFCSAILDLVVVAIQLYISRLTSQHHQRIFYHGIDVVVVVTIHRFVIVLYSIFGHLFGFPGQPSYMFCIIVFVLSILMCNIVMLFVFVSLHFCSGVHEDIVTQHNEIHQYSYDVC